MKKLLILLIMFGLITQSFAYNDYTYYVDPDVVGGLGDGSSWANAYSSLQAAETAQQRDLVSSDDRVWFQCRASAGTADIKAAFSGWSTDVDNTIWIVGDDFPADGIFDTSKYSISINSGSSAAALESNLNSITIRNIQIETAASSTAQIYGIFINNKFGNTIDSCIIRSFGNTTSGRHFGIYPYICDPVTIWNTTVTGYWHISDNDYKGIRCYGNNGNNYNLYNCTFFNNRIGIHQDLNEEIYAYNCIISSNTNDFLIDGAGSVIDYCASDDGDGTNAVAASGGDWDNEMNDPGNEDFTLITGGNCENAGTDDPSSGLYLDDITDTTRVSVWSIGAYGAPAAAPAPTGGVLPQIW